MKNFKLYFLLAGLCLSFSLQTHAQACKLGAKARIQMWAKFGDYPKNLSSAKWHKQAALAIRYFNRENHNDETVFAVKPDSHTVGSIEGKGRHILVFAPAYKTSKRFMIIKNHNSEAKATYTVCTAAKGRTMENEYEVTFALDDETGTRNVLVENTKAKATIIVIQNHTKGGVLNYVVTDVTDSQ